MATKRANVGIRFFRPYWYHKRPAEMFEAEKRLSKKAGKAGNNPNEWRDTYYATKEGELYIPQEAVFTCIRDAGRFQKRGKAQLTSYLASTVQVLTNTILTGRSLNGETPPTNELDEPVYLDVRAVKNPNSRGSTNIRYRVALSAGVETEFSLAFDDTIVHANELHQALIDAGTLVGLGDGRSIGMGRFEVTDFNVE